MARETVIVNTKRDHLLEAGGLRVRFFWHGDRFAHDVWLRSGADWVRVLSSVEGSPDDEWPPSPPLQSLHVEERRAGPPVALLVGMAGKCHWSASAEIDPRAGCVSFDVACRVSECGGGVLSSTYRDEAIGAEDRPRFETGKEAASAQLEPRGDIVRVLATDSSAQGPRTIRWKYRITSRPARGTTGQTV